MTGKDKVSVIPVNIQQQIPYASRLTLCLETLEEPVAERDISAYSTLLLVMRYIVGQRVHFCHGVIMRLV